jgi:anti-sigma B factor antagonist
MTAQTTVIRHDSVVRITPVRTTSSDEWRAAIALYGELDVANAHELRTELAEHLAAGRRVIRVDAAGVEFLDSTALAELIVATELCAADHGSLILTNVPPRVRRVLNLAGLDHRLLIDTAGDVDGQRPA